MIFLHFFASLNISLLTSLSMFFESFKIYQAECWPVMPFRVLFKRCTELKKNSFCLFWPKTPNFSSFLHELPFLQGHISRTFQNFKNACLAFLTTLLKIVCANFLLSNLYSILKTWIDVKNSIEKRLLFYCIGFPLYFTNPTNFELS